MHPNSKVVHLSFVVPCSTLEPPHPRPSVAAATEGVSI